MTTLFKYVQVQDFSLAGAGGIAGATSLTLKSFKTIDGALLTMTDFGSIGFGTLEPGNGIQEEQISFTGVVQNANGTATLTGVKSVLFVNPYTATTGLAKTHAGSTPFIISNTSGFYDQFTAKNNDETIPGNWDFTGQVTFAIAPISPITNPLATNLIYGISKLSVAAVSPTDPIVVGTNDLRMPVAYAVDAVGTDAYAINPSPAITAYVAGQHFTFQAGVANTGAATLNVSGLGAKPIVKDVSSALVTGDILLNQITEVVYDGTNMQMISQRSGNIDTPAIDIQIFTSSGTWTMPVGAKSLKIELIGGGGGGGGNVAGSSSNGSGGGGGGYNLIFLSASQVTSPVTITIPAAAAGGIGSNDGATGGNVTFGSYATGYGGGGGSKGDDTSTGGGGGGGMGSVGAVGTSAAGGAGGSPQGGATGTASYFGGAGGTFTGVGALSFYGGGGGAGGSGAANAGGASTFGGGGGGAGSYNSGGGAGGTSLFAGAGGVGSGFADVANGSPGVAPGGGGGGSGTQGGGGVAHNGGAGAKGQIVVTTYF